MTPLKLAAMVGGFVVAPIAYLLVAGGLDSAADALGAFVRSDAGRAASDANTGGALAIVFVVMPMLAVLGALTGAVATRPTPKGRWAVLIACVAAVMFLMLAWLGWMLFSTNWQGRAVPQAAAARFAASVLFAISSYLPALWAALLALWCLRRRAANAP